MASVTVLIMFLLFLYAMAGHYLFGSALPDHWGDVGRAEAMAVTPVALVFFLSYVFIIVFTILNVLIGIVINAMDESRAQEQRATRDHWREILDAIDGLERDGDANQRELIVLRQEIIRVQSGHVGQEQVTLAVTVNTSVRRGAGKRNTGRARSTD